LRVSRSACGCGFPVLRQACSTWTPAPAPSKPAAVLAGCRGPAQAVPASPGLHRSPRALHGAPLSFLECPYVSITSSLARLHPVFETVQTKSASNKMAKNPFRRPPRNGRIKGVPFLLCLLLMTITLTAADPLLRSPKSSPGRHRQRRYPRRQLFLAGNREDPDTLKYLEAENRYTEAVMNGRGA